MYCEKHQPIKRGTKVLIKKGTALTSCNPSRRSFVAGRDYIATITYYTDAWMEDHISWHPAQVAWAGAHGYWTYAKVADVVILPDNLTLVEELAKRRNLI